MNRNIKFRIWWKKHKRWLTEKDYGTHCYSNWFINPFNGNVVDCVSHDHFAKKLEKYEDEQDQFVVEQYARLKDKKGRDIYEGDILINKTSDQDYNKPCVVAWSNYEEVGWSACYTKPEHLKGKGLQEYLILQEGLKKTFYDVDVYEDFPLTYFYGDYEIIGNVHENLELLK